MYNMYLCFRLFRQRLDRLIFLQVDVEVGLVRVALGLDDLVDHVYEHGDVRGERGGAEDRVDRRVIGRAHHLHALILKERERLGKHAPDGQRLRAVLEPRALAERKRAERRRGQQRKTRIERVRRDAVVGIGEIPDVIGDDPEPEHVRPEHVAAGVALCGLAQDDSEPAGDRHDAEQPRDAVHDVPRAAEHAGDFAFDRAGVDEPVLRADLEVAHARFENVDRKDQRREAKRDFTVRQPPGDFARELVLFLNVADRPEADAARRRGVHLHQVEPVGIGLFTHHREPEHGQNRR